MGSFFAPKQNAGAIQAAQEAAAQKERDRLANEEFARKEAEDRKLSKEMDKAESRRKAFTGSFAKEGDTTQRRRFLTPAA
jgi:hypothetical protein